MNRSIETFSVTCKKDFAANGIRLGDLLTIKPIWGRRSEHFLKHTEFYFKSEACPDSDKKVLLLPAMKEENFAIGLQLTKSFSIDLQVEERFFIYSLDEKPFWINGNWSLECFLERGDQVKIGNNILEFKSGNSGAELRMDSFLPVLGIESKLINSNLNVLIEGETGTGKSFTAHKIHQVSNRKGPFVHLNLSAYGPHLLESELFGHCKGSFTGAIKDKKGAFEEADHGTLFLDEMDSISPEIQTKLLLFLDNGFYRRVGDNKVRKSDARLIFASGRNLSALVEQRKFRHDLYFRISNGAIQKLPSLREKPLLIQKICQKYSIDHDLIISNELIEFYQTLPWAGNIRQFLGHLKKKKILANSRKLFFDELDESLLKESSNLLVMNDKFQTLQEIKEAYVKKVFYECQKNLSLSSRKLDISRGTIKRILGKVA